MRLMDMIVKDMKNVLYDVKSLAILLLMPVVLMTILGMSLQGVFGTETESGITMAKVGIVQLYDYNEQMYKVEGRMDISGIDTQTLEGLDAQRNFFSLMDNEEIRKFLTYELMAEEEGFEALENGDIAALIVLPENFVFNSYMLLQGSRLVSEIDYYINEENDFLANIILGIIEGYTDMTNHIYAQQRLITVQMLASGNAQALADMGEMFTEQSFESGAVNLSVQSATREETISSFQYYAAAIMCMFLLYSAGIGGRALLQERNERTIPRLTVGGNGLGMIMTSNFLRVMLVTTVQSGIMITYSNLVLGVQWGDAVTVILTVLLSSFAVASIGMLIGVITLLANDYKIANAFEFGLVYFLALVGGSYIPVEVLPEAMQQMGVVAPNGQALKMYINGMYEMPLSDSIPQIIALTLLGISFIAVSMLLIRGKGRELAC